MNLTERQGQVLEFIEETLAMEGRPPTLREIAKHFGYSAVGTVEDHVKALVKKGYLDRDKGVVCGLRPTHFAPATSVPILGVVPAGRPIEALEEALGSLTVPSKLKGELFALRVKGDSMRDAGILEGDYVIVKKQQSAEHGEIVVALIDGEATVKRLEKRGGRVRLIAENPKYSPIELNPEQENLIQGKVLSLQRFFDRQSS